MDASKFVWNKVLVKNIGAMAEAADEALLAMKHNPAILYDPQAPLQVDWSKVHETKEAIPNTKWPFEDLLKSADMSPMTKAMFTPDIYAAIEPMFTEDEVQQLKAFAAKKVEYGAKDDTAALLPAMQMAFSILQKCGAGVKGVMSDVTSHEIPTVTVQFEAFHGKMSENYKMVNLLIEAIHTHNKAFPK